MLVWYMNDEGDIEFERSSLQVGFNVWWPGGLVERRGLERLVGADDEFTQEFIA